ncbi:protein ALP1-like [Lucilia sericata]|uniref:protein ALP1-like n=1 Tax=Lucilia sericata TaxID=13632 RepID=UPI0018A83702|nr:protein ALP1-like [Lucilia sericata]
MLLMPYDYVEKFMEIFKFYLAFVNFIDVVVPNQNRSLWTREEFRQNERELYSLYNDLLELIKQHNSREFRKFTRINVSTYQYLIRILKKKLVKYSLRKPIPPECRLMLTLIYLAHDSARTLLSLAFRMGKSTVREIILDTCQVICEELGPSYLKSSKSTADDYFAWAEEFEKETGLPNCMGCIDIIEFQHDKKCFSPIITMAACNAKYQITHADVALPKEIKEKDNFINRLIQKQLQLPNDMVMPDTGLMLSPYFITPANFPLVDNVMRPYPGKILTPEKHNLNENLKVGSRLIENTLGILIWKWKVLQNKFTCRMDIGVEHIVKATMILHNFAMQHDSCYFHKKFVDHYDDNSLEFVPGLWRQQDFQITHSKIYYESNAKEEAFANRDLLKEYLYNKHNNQ